jgi:hypothetical protein
MKVPLRDAMSSLSVGSPATADAKSHAPPLNVCLPLSEARRNPRVSDSSFIERSALS